MHEVDSAVPFGSVFMPYVREARSQLGDLPDCIEPSFMDDLARALLDRMASVGATAVLEHFQAERRVSEEPTSPPVAYDRYVGWLVGSDHRRLREIYPVLWQLLADLAHRWVQTTTQTLRRIDADHALLSEMVGADAKFTRTSGPLGDPHNGGDSVLVLTTSLGRRVVYKPRSLAQELRVFELIRWGNERDGDLSFIPRVADRGRYGWMEFVEALPSPEAADYWRRAGRTTAMLYLAGAVDLHNGNVIATQGSVVPIDLECVEQPVLWRSAKPRTLGLDDTVVSTGLLPNHYTGDGVVARDVGGLLAHQQQSGGAWLDEWRNLGTGAIEKGRRLSEWGADNNRPVDDHGVALPVDLAAFQRGFEAGAELGRRADAPLLAWDPLPARVLLRSTMVYMDQLASLTNSAALADQSVFNERMRGLPPFPSAVALSLGGQAVASVDASESAALGRLDVPLHRAHGIDLWLDGGEKVADALALSGQERRSERLQWVAGPRLRAQQQLVQLAVEQHEGAVDQPDRTPVVAGASSSRTELVAAAEALANSLVLENLGAPDRPWWLEVDQAGHRQMRGVFRAEDLYSGRLGIGVFFGALAATTDDDSWEKWARRCIAAPFELATPWWESGLAGAAYSTLIVGDMLADPKLTDEAESLAGRALRDMPDASAAMDVVGGWGGVLNTVLAVIERRPDAELRGRALALTDSMASAIRHQLEDPVAARGLHRAGFAHGVSGVGYTMQRAACLLGSTAAAQLADELIEFDLRRTSERDGIAGRVDRIGRVRKPTTSWCWGATGYLLSRTSDVMLKRDDVVAAHVAASLPPMCQSAREPHHLCCGEAGRLVMLDAVGRNLDSAEARAGANALAATLADDARAPGPFHFYAATTFDAPSLFWGRVGIGYALCRVAAPTMVPNVLLIE